MLSIICNNVNEAFSIGMMHFRTGIKNSTLIEANTRGQRRLQYPMPIVTTYKNPRERVLFDSVRDCNPFFHFMESLWILAGRNDVAWLEQWLSTIREYSDNGVSFHGAYGYRVLQWGQLENAANRLMCDPDSTRAVVAIYDGQTDTRYEGKDMPCNCMIFLGIQKGKLNITVANRSNDMIWGAYGANVVQFSMLQEYIAAMIGCEVGWYAQMSNNAHIYPDNEVTKKVLASPSGYSDPYGHDLTAPLDFFPIVDSGSLAAFRVDIDGFMNGNEHEFLTPFFNKVVEPMRRAHMFYRRKLWGQALAAVSEIAAEDWCVACTAWISRRHKNAIAKGTDK